MRVDRRYYPFLLRLLLIRRNVSRASSLGSTLPHLISPFISLSTLYESFRLLNFIRPSTVEVKFECKQSFLEQKLFVLRLL
jgi:hypothetical protein